MSSAGKAIVASIGNESTPHSLRVYTWYPNKKLGGEHVPGYSAFHDDSDYNSWKRTDVYGEEFLTVFPNSIIDLDSPEEREKASNGEYRLSRVAMSDYWENDRLQQRFLRR